MITRKLGEIGIKWILPCIEGGNPLPLTGAKSVELVVVDGPILPCVIDNAAGGIVSFTNTFDDLSLGKHDYYLEVMTSTLAIWKSKQRELEITA